MSEITDQEDVYSKIVMSRELLKLQTTVFDEMIKTQSRARMLEARLDEIILLNANLFLAAQDAKRFPHGGDEFIVEGVKLLQKGMDA